MSSGIVEGSIYIYAPNKAAPIVFALLFAISGFIHIWQCLHYKSLKWTFLHPLCCLMFTAGFALREYGAYNYTVNLKNLDIFIASTCLIYMAPPLLELTNYHVLGRILYYVPYLSPLHPGRVLSTFAFLSAIVELLNAIGVSYTANIYLSESYRNLGCAFAKASLIVQFVVMGLFILLAVTFQRRCIKAGIPWRQRKVHAPLLTLYLSTTLLLARTIYRTVEYFSFTSTSRASDPADLTPVMHYEWFFWVFEAMLMSVNTLLWNGRHPRLNLPEDKKTYLARDGVTEVEGPGWEDGRGFWLTFMDPFDWLKRGKNVEWGPGV